MPLAPMPTTNVTPRELQLWQQLQAEQSRIQRLESQLQKMQQTVEASLERLEADSSEDELTNASANWDRNFPLPLSETNQFISQRQGTGVMQVSNSTPAVPQTMNHALLEQFPEARQHANPQQQSVPATPPPQAKPGFRDRLRSMLPFGRH
jgi:hypothetical protein